MGYVHNVHMSQYIPPTAMHCVTGTYTNVAGQVVDTVCVHRAANAATGVVNIPIILPSSTTGQQGAMLNSIEVDYELLVAVAVSVTAVLNKVTRGADTVVASVAVPTITQDLAAGVAAVVQDQHKLTVTVTTPAWTDDDEYYLLEMSFECGAAVTIDVLAAVANYTLRV